MPHPLAFAQVQDPGAQEQCPISMEMTPSEKKAFTIFKRRLSGLNGHYGKFYFQKYLNAIVEKQWPTERVIEISPLFTERILNLIDQQYLRHAVASTIGLKNKNWISFEYTMRDITIDDGFLFRSSERKNFAETTKQLIEDIKNHPIDKMQLIRSANERKKPFDPELAGNLKAEAVMMIMNMHLYLERWNLINKELSRLRSEANTKKIMFAALVVGGGAFLIASTVYTPMIVAAVGPYAAAYGTNLMVGAQFARFAAQVGVGVAAGSLGAPAAMLTADSLSILLNSAEMSRNNKTVYACEINKQIDAWKKQGVSPYIKAAIFGGTIGFGGAATYFKLGAKTLLLATTFGVGVALKNSVGQLYENSMLALAEYRLALDAIESGNRETAVVHLQKSRTYANEAGDQLLNSIIVAALSASVAKDFPKAITQGEDIIRAIYANSSDTLPTAINVLTPEMTN